MRSTFALLVLTVCTVLSGCQTTPPPEIQIRYQNVVLAVPDDLIVDCKITPPPLVVDYMALPTWSDKEGVLVESDAANIENLGACNVQWANVRKWKAKSVAAAASTASAPTK